MKLFAFISLLLTSSLLQAQPLVLYSDGQHHITLSQDQARHIGMKIWKNEGNQKHELLTVWNEGEEFPSFGIGHFIWYPPDIEGPFRESFPGLITMLSEQQALPEWLLTHQDAPWISRRHFYRQFDQLRLTGLRQLLAETLPQQVAYIIQRMQRALPQMLETIPPAQRPEIRERFIRVIQHPNGSYALIDYVNFKGEGTSPSERYQGKGWGLLQVLQQMDDTADVMADFAKAADHVLTRRVNNAPRDERRWLKGWRKRINSYLIQ